MGDETSAKPALLIMAAGLGSRYGGLKQLDSFGPNGELLLEYAAYDAWRSGFSKIVLVLNSTVEAAFQQHFIPRIQRKLAVEYVLQDLKQVPKGMVTPPERIKPWGTGQAVWIAARFILEPFGVINGDDFYGPEAFATMANFLRQPPNSDKPVFAMVGYQLQNTLSEYGAVARGICTVNELGQLQGVEEITHITKTERGIECRSAAGAVHPLSGKEITSMNFFGFTPAFFPIAETNFRKFLQQQPADQPPEFYLPEIVNQAVKKGLARVQVLPTTETWFGVTYRQEKLWVVEKIQKLIAAGQYPVNLWD